MTTDKTSVETLWDEIFSIQKILETHKEVSLLSDYNNTIRKVLLLSCGSYFEKEMTEMLKEYVRNIAKNDKIVSFLEKQAIHQKYHTLFDWGKQNEPLEHNGSKNINKFTGLFGNDFKELVNNELTKDIEFNKSKEAFIEIGHIRNILVHNDFASYSYENKTPKEIYDLYQVAKSFIPKINELLEKDSICSHLNK
ncbi:HEPN domain-containing protein [Capnocytophaga canimorsus]|uniref:HEPN domain-containing protein n=1 Tax=Capnocytophaga canimorsus TaxID=28188 RepID=UPI001AC5EF3D|nr:HEPN domain-containing protein [Capnocytophaga canimorsus]GIM59917.1 hypothetical protein CAPN007_21260 [Capnocytophaga canimorsus]